MKSEGPVSDSDHCFTELLNVAGTPFSVSIAIADFGFQQRATKTLRVSGSGDD